MRTSVLEVFEGIVVDVADDGGTYYAGGDSD